ncbi:ribose-phosphate pyrophosphokinase [Bacilli bacterium PM5-3]|nr:ribose-phosphate pyrophosphokinase [Bacilli bacterium PM5-3]MDH6603322.1 ribose-phosphate pyrophosphokinase [Bacilli bacterium PM5-9]
MLSRTLIFSLSTSKHLTEKVCEKLGVEQAKCNVKNFADGETLVEIEQSVRGKNCYVVQSTCAPTNESIMELLIMIDALKRASARTINVIIPYYGYARQDRKAKPRQPITSRLVADMLQTAGANRIITFDLHASQIQGFFTIPIDDIYALPLLATHFKSLPSEDIVVVSPDHGGTTRARSLAKILDCPIAIIDKRRPKANVAEVMNIIGSVEGKIAILIDDMIDTAGTICAGAKAIKDLGATKVLACCTHPVLSGPAIERIQDSVIESLITTDSIELPVEKQIDKIKVISIAPIVASVIDHIENVKPVSEAVSQYE